MATPAFSAVKVILAEVQAKLKHFLANTKSLGGIKWNNLNCKILDWISQP